MSVKVMSWVWDRSRAERNDRLVLLAIADHAHHDGGGSYPGIELLAAMTNLSERTVQRAITRLVELGELRVELNAGGDADCRDDRRPNRYTVLLAHTPDRAKRTRRRASRHGTTAVSPRPDSGDDIDVTTEDAGGLQTTRDDLHERGDSSDAPSSGARGDTGDVDGVTPEARRGDTGVTQTVLDPSTEPSNPPNPHCVGAQGTRDAGTNPRAIGTDPRTVGTNPRALELDAFFAIARRDDHEPVPVAAHLARMRDELDRGLDTEGAQP